MASNITFSINGIDITLSNGFGSIELLMSPEKILESDSHKFFSAIEEIKNTLHYIEDIFWINEYSGMGDKEKMKKRLESIIFNNPYTNNKFRKYARKELRVLEVGDKNKQTRDRSHLKRHGYVYFLFGDGKYKIGKTKILENRMSWYTLKLPFKCSLEHTIESNDYAFCESYFHKKFNDKLVNGEWYDLTEEDITQVKGISVKNF